MRGTLGQDALSVITAEHARIHAGEMFKGGVSSAALAAAGYLYIELIVPASPRVHLKAVEFYCSLAGTYTLIEAPTITDGTTAVDLLNRDRNSLRGSACLAYSDPSGISLGTTLETASFTGSLLSNVGPQMNDIEWILKPSTKYLLRLQNNGGSNATAFLRCNMYEPR